jgi:hypothetical protein
MAGPGIFWEPPEPGESPPSPATWEEIRRWEAEHSVQLPRLLAEALAVADGGRVRETSSLDINSLAEFETLGCGDWDHIYQEEEGSGPEVVDRDRLFLIGDCFGCGIVLDYRGKQEPAILMLEYEVGGRLRDSGLGTFEELVLDLRSDANGA